MAVCRPDSLATALADLKDLEVFAKADPEALGVLATNFDVLELFAETDPETWEVLAIDLEVLAALATDLEALEVFEPSKDVPGSVLDCL